MDELKDLQERVGVRDVTSKAPSNSGDVRRVHAVFKTHLDVGFTDSASNVMQAYYRNFIPRALDVAAELRARGGQERLAWTTGSWLIYEFLEQADTGMRRRMDEAIEAGDFTWHALPFTFHSEYMDASLFRFGLTLSAELDARYGRKTIAAKMTDVPGHSRSIVPLLAEAGVQFLHLGVNPACPQPSVPPLFRWQGPADSEIMVMYNSGYGVTLVVPGIQEVLAFSHRGENSGPPSSADVIEQFDRLRSQFPQAEVVPSTMDCFAAHLAHVRQNFPVVCSEIGDTWIHGVGTDPAKTSGFRALCRLRREWESSGCVSSADHGYAKFSRTLLFVPEHTWGKDEKTHLSGERSPEDTYMTKDPVYEAVSFTEARKTDRFQQFEASWREQRAYLKEAVLALSRRDLKDAANRSLVQTAAVRPPLGSFAEMPDRDSVVETQHFTVAIDPGTGAICSLQLKESGRVLANAEHLLGLFRYQTFSQGDYERFINEYCINMEHDWCYNWALPDFSKPNIDAAGAVSCMATPSCRWIGTKISRDAVTLLVELHFEAALAVRHGAPGVIYIEYRFPNDNAGIELTLQWFEKNASRLPEAMWLSFVPVVPEAASWALDKMGSAVSPLDVVQNGNRSLHAVTRGVSAGSADDRIMIDSLDVPLVAPGEPRLLQFDNSLPSLEKGMHFNLYNNVWGTNFPMWYEDDGKCRFVLRFQE